MLGGALVLQLLERMVLGLLLAPRRNARCSDGTKEGVAPRLAPLRGALPLRLLFMGLA